MSIVDIALLAVLAIAFISGMQKGFLASLLATFAFVAAWAAALAIYPALSASFMRSQFRVWLEANATFDSLLTPLGVTRSLCATVAGQAESICQAISEGGVPAAIVDAFRSGFAANGSLTVSEYLSETVWQAAFRLVSFIISFGFVYAALLLVVNLVNNMFKIPKLRGVDALFGGIIGAVRGYAIVCLIAAVVPMVFAALDSSVVESLLEGSTVGAFFLDEGNSLRDVFHVSGQITKIITGAS